MPDTATTSGRLRKIEVGTRINLWGSDWNTNLDLLDDQIDGFGTTVVNADVTLSSANFASDESRKAIQKFTGAGGFTVTIPSVRKRYIVWNACTAAVTLSAGGTSYVIDPNSIELVLCDGSNVKPVGYNGLNLKQYVASVVLGTLSGLPAVSGNAGKVMYTDGASAFWKLPEVADLSDYATDQATKTADMLGKAIAFAIAL